MFMRVKRACAVAAAIVLAAAVGGCAGSNGASLLPFLGQNPPQEAQPAPKPRAGCKTAEACAAVLRKLVSGKNRDWIGKVQPPEAYDDGTRLFAYRALKRKLTCAELARAFHETREVLPSLVEQAHAGSRTLMQAIQRELAAERRSRCREKA